MLTIRLRRHGAKRDPHYRVVVTEQADGRDGPFIEILGHYHPRRQPAEIALDLARADAWIGRGAQMSDTVASLYRRVKAGEAAPDAATAAAPGEAPEAVSAAPAAPAEAPGVEGTAGEAAEQETSGEQG